MRCCVAGEGGSAAQVGQSEFLILVLTAEQQRQDLFGVFVPMDEVRC